jgi:CheY-like chemotaxis protein
MPPNLELFTTSVLLIDGNHADRAYFAEGLKSCSPDYLILDAANGQSGLDLYRSRQIDCVVMELELPDRSGFEVLIELVPLVRKPKIAVIVLTHVARQGSRALAEQNGAYAYFVKKFTSGEDLDRAIQRAVSLVGLLPKEDRFRPILSRQK